MPELPEVEIVRRGLDRAMRHKRIRRMELKRPDLRIPFPDGFGQALVGRRVEELHRRGKYILINLDNGRTVILHLGMSGRFTILPPDESAPVIAPEIRHDHVHWLLDDGTRIIYSDPRRFGLMTLSDSDALDRHPLLAQMGLEPLGGSLTGSGLAALFDGRTTTIKAALLDQKLIAGLGNIYVCEALFGAGISPRRTARTVRGRRGDRLAASIEAVLREAIAAGGSTLRDYAHTDGSLGYFQHSFKVYDREGRICAAGGCDRKISRIVQSNRSTFYCASCQR